MTVGASSSLLLTLLLSATPHPTPPNPAPQNRTLGKPELKASALPGASTTQTSPVGRRIEHLALRDVLGAPRSLDDWKDKQAIVVVFLCAECPLARQYAPKLDAMAQKYADKRVQFVGIDANPQDTLAELEHFQRVHKVGFPILRDPGTKVADEFGARRTPEVFLLDRGHVVRYWGRIDDQFGIGYGRNKPVHRWLEDALDAVLDGKNVQTAVVESVGCRIGRVNRQPKGDVTYAKQIAPILQSRCVSCHQAGEIAPFALNTYADAGEYPMNGPIEIRVTGLDNPADALVSGAQSPILSSVRPRPDQPDWDVAVWLDMGTLPVTAGFSAFYAEMESWIWSHYTGSYACVRPEWSKAWACTSTAPWTNSTTLGSTIPAAVRTKYAASGTTRARCISMAAYIAEAPNPAPIAITATASSGTALSRTMTRRSMPSRAPVSRSRLNGRLRSASPPATLTARVQPAMTRLVRITTSASCW